DGRGHQRGVRPQASQVIRTFQKRKHAAGRSSGPGGIEAASEKEARFGHDIVRGQGYALDCAIEKLAEEVVARVAPTFAGQSHEVGLRLLLSFGQSCSPIFAVDEFRVRTSGDGNVLEFGEAGPVLLGDIHQRQGDGGRDPVSYVRYEVDIL